MPAKGKTFSSEVPDHVRIEQAIRLNLKPYPQIVRTSSKDHESYHINEWRDFAGKLYFYTVRDRSNTKKTAFEIKEYLNIWRDVNW